eukprot:2237755-Alexandrium_andersonii.AAC.1
MDPGSERARHDWCSGHRLAWAGTGPHSATRARQSSAVMCRDTLRTHAETKQHASYSGERKCAVPPGVRARCRG